MARPMRRAAPVTRVAPLATRFLSTAVAMEALPRLALGEFLGRLTGPAADRATAHGGKRRAAARAGRGVRRARRAKAEIEFLQALDLVPEPRRFLEFEIGRRLAHLLLEIGDHRFEVRALVMRLLALAEIDGNVIRLINAVEDVGDAALDAFRRDAVGGVIGLLLLAPPHRLVDRLLHAFGHGVGVEDDAAVEIARGAA